MSSPSIQLAANPTTYSLVNCTKGRRSGITSPLEGAVGAVIKIGNDEVPWCAYNEHVAFELGKRIGAPVATGALVQTGHVVSFASLAIQLAGVKLHNVPKRDLAKAIELYPDSCARILAFDYWIGNWDRGSNIKISVLGNALTCFAAFDHSHCLLSISNSPDESIKQLAAREPVPLAHPFESFVRLLPLSNALQRISDIPDYQIEDCCRTGTLFPEVPESIQAKLATALSVRREFLASLIWGS